ncbi:MAG: hypothetical protein AAFR87_10175 [Bacteroidota bacterium]
MKKNPFSLSTIFICILSYFILFIIEMKIVQDYQNASGKTQALFGVKEVIMYGYKYNLAFVGIIGLVLTFIGFRRNEETFQLMLGGFLALILLFLPLAGIWRIFV